MYSLKTVILSRCLCLMQEDFRCNKYVLKTSQKMATKKVDQKTMHAGAVPLHIFQHTPAGDSDQSISVRRIMSGFRPGWSRSISNSSHTKSRTCSQSKRRSIAATGGSSANRGSPAPTSLCGASEASTRTCATNRASSQYPEGDWIMEKLGASTCFPLHRQLPQT